MEVVAWILAAVVLVVVLGGVRSPKGPPESLDEPLRQRSGRGSRGEVFAVSRHHPPGEWVKASWRLKVAGLKFRANDVEIWANACRQAERMGTVYGAYIRPEPSNPHDKNALAVMGFAEFDSRHEWHIGYLPREDAAEIKADLIDKGVPVSLELWSIYEGADGFFDVNVIVLAPPGNSESARRRRKAGAAQ